MRKNDVVHVDSSEVQEQENGSYVVLKRPKWKMLRQALGAFQNAGGESNQAEAGLAMMEVLLPLMVVEWNWVDEDGQPMPLPSRDPTVLDEMDPAAALFLINRASELVKFDRKN